MKVKSLLSLLVLGSILSSCHSKSEDGALIGSVVGVTAGALIDGGGGAIVGGALGALSGGLIGHALDKEGQKKASTHSPGVVQRVNQNDTLTVKDVEALSRAGMDTQRLLALLKQSQSQFEMTTQDVLSLKKAGVSEEVINYMIQSGS